MIGHKNDHLFDTAQDELEFWGEIYLEWTRRYLPHRGTDRFVPLSTFFSKTQSHIDSYREWKVQAG